MGRYSWSLRQNDIVKSLQRREWWTDSFIETIRELVSRLVSNRPVINRNGGLVLLNYNRKFPGAKVNAAPIPAFGNDRDWREKDWIGLLNTDQASGEHWVAVAIFGPQRMAVVYDSAGGQYDPEDPEMRKWGVSTC
jgi:hypothetical protein